MGHIFDFQNQQSVSQQMWRKIEHYTKLEENMYIHCSIITKRQSHMAQH